MTIKPDSARRHGFALGIIATVSSGALLCFGLHAPVDHGGFDPLVMAGALGSVFLFAIAVGSTIAGLANWGTEAKPK